MEYILLSVVAMVLFGIDLSISKVIVGHIPPESVALLRVIAASLSIGAFVIFTGIETPLSIYVGYACVAGAFLGIGFIFTYVALARGPASVVTPIIELCTVLPATFGVLVLNESLTISKLIGLPLAFIAIVLLSR